MTEVTVTAPSRLHFGLLDLGGASPRRYGGVGLMVDAFPTIVTARTARATTVTASAAVDRQHRSAVMRALTELPHTRNVSVNIDSAAPPHLGLGSKTSLVLACLRAADELQPKSSGRAALQRASGRGGTSGIGVNGFFTGGFLLDAGTRRRTRLTNRRDHRARMPSHRLFAACRSLLHGMFGCLFPRAK